MAAPPGLPALFAEAVRLHRSGRLAEADGLYRDVLSAQPRHADSLYLRGTIAETVGRPDVAATFFTSAIEARGDVAPFHFSLGSCLQRLGRTDDAIAAFRRGLALQPNDAAALNALGTMLQQAGQSVPAAAAYRRALALSPRDGASRNNLAVVLKAQGRLAEAVVTFEAAIADAPNDASLYFNLGNALHDQVHLDAAVAAFRKAVALQPSYGEAHNNLAIALNDAWRLDEAADAYQAALALAPDRAEAHSAWLAFLHYRPENDAPRILAEARRFGERFGSVPPVARRFAGTPPGGRLKVGYVSGDFRHHPVGTFLAPVLAHHDRTAFEIHGYSNNPRADDLTERLRGHCDHWRTIAGMPDEAAARMIAEDGIDILIDLSGHTAMNRLPLFARKPAPLQATWLGYWGTTGLAAMDVCLSDPVTVPPGEETAYSETVVRLPQGRFCYGPPDYAPLPAAGAPVGRNGSITFGSFNNPDKITPAVVTLWASVLQAVPRSRLILKWATLADDGVRWRLAEAFGKMGIAADRLIFRRRSPHAEMLAEYADVDIALDPFPFSGGLTSCEALWMGVPVVTLPGALAPSRQTLGFLRAIGQADWAATSAAHYVAIATGLAGDGKGLDGWRRTLRARMAASPLCDGAAFTGSLEAALRELWQQRRGAPA